MFKQKLIEYWATKINWGQKIAGLSWFNMVFHFTFKIQQNSLAMLGNQQVMFFSRDDLKMFVL